MNPVQEITFKLSSACDIGTFWSVPLPKPFIIFSSPPDKPKPIHWNSIRLGAIFLPNCAVSLPWIPWQAV